MTDPPAVAVLVMDLGGVACRWLPDRRLVALAELSGLPAGTIDELVFGSGWDDACERGRFSARETFDQLRSLLGLSMSTTDDALRAAWALAYEPDAAVLGVLPYATCPAAMLTNNGPIMEAALDVELARVGHAFDRLLLSWRLEATKPSPACFEAATAALDVERSAVLFVDDSEDNVAAARVFGWDAHRYTDALNLRNVLYDRGVMTPGPASPRGSA